MWAVRRGKKIISVETEKALDRIEKSFHDEMLKKLEVEGIYSIRLKSCLLKKKHS